MGEKREALKNSPFRLCLGFLTYIVDRRPRPVCGSCPRSSDRTSPRRFLARTGQWGRTCLHLHCPTPLFYIHAFPCPNSLCASGHSRGVTESATFCSSLLSVRADLLMTKAHFYFLSLLRLEIFLSTLFFLSFFSLSLYIYIVLFSTTLSSPSFLSFSVSQEVLMFLTLSTFLRILIHRLSV